MALVDEDDVLANAHHRIHVVGIDDRRHLKLLGDAVKQFVDDQARFGVKSAVRLIAKQVLGIHTDGSGYGNTFLHATTDLSWELALGTNQIDAVKAGPWHVADAHEESCWRTCPMET